MIRRVALPIALVLASPAHAQNSAQPNARIETATISFHLVVDETGKLSRCGITASSGNAVVDGKMCEIMLAKARFTPRLDESGKPVKFELNKRMVLNVTE